MGKKYDIFLSYRRDGGESTARILRDQLTQRGYRVFLDVEALASGAFDAGLFSVIDECTDFLLILSPGSLERCAQEDDWVELFPEQKSKPCRQSQNQHTGQNQSFSMPETMI